MTLFAPSGFPIYLGPRGSEAPQESVNFVELPLGLDYLSPGDIVSLEENGERIKAAYGANLGKLVEIKTKWDPRNLFRMNKNIVPHA